MLDVLRFMLFSMNIPKTYWGHTILTAIILLTISRVLDKKSPLDVLFKSSYPFFISPQVLECTYFVWDHNLARGKLDPRALKCVFVSYSSTQKLYKYYHPSFIKLFVYMDVTFFKSQSYFSSSPIPLQREIQDKVVSCEDKNEK